MNLGEMPPSNAPMVVIMLLKKKFWSASRMIGPYDADFGDSAMLDSSFRARDIIPARLS